MRPLSVKLLPVALVASLCCSCEPFSKEPGVPAFTTWDSAGVDIALSSAPAWGAETPWTVSESPRLWIGGQGSPIAHEIWNVTGGARLSQGRIALLVGGMTAPRILIVDRGGSIVRSSGRLGRGPGEFVDSASAREDLGILSFTPPIRLPRPITAPG